MDKNTNNNKRRKKHNIHDFEVERAIYKYNFIP